ncbi:hypothetical protein Pmani_013504 [Petrolisthes manimaculis]|uniref:Sodium-coupled monocarboxylate transporter 1 n=1 Tax=Petrolisthes manimaculis TaxID=1843537 RepID=A0AAE1PWB0_9EUCA|nr:hypothetical protein Pmani_013504 [Petrolisthes manimaculis]
MEGEKQNGEGVANFTLTDYTLFGIMLCVSLGIGLYTYLINRNKTTVEDYLLGGRNMGFLPVGLSLLGGIVSAVSILGNPTEVYLYGTQLCMTLVGFIPTCIFIIYVILPIFYSLRITSLPQYLHLRFNSKLLSTLGCVFMLMEGFIYMGVCLYAPSVAMSAVTKVSPFVFIVATGLVCTFYTSIGGAKAVVYTDVLQTLLMLTGVLLVIVMCVVQLGGLQYMWTTAVLGERIQFFNMDPNPLVRHSFWSTTVLGMYLGLSFVGLHQSSLMRFASVPSLVLAQRLVVFFLVGLWLLWGVFFLSGIVAYVMYKDCDPLTAGYINKPDQIIIYLVMDKLGHYTGLSGVFVAAIYGGVLSSLSSSANCSACLIWETLLKDNIKFFNKMSKNSALSVLKILSCITGIIGILMGLMVGQLGNIFHVLNSINNAITGPIRGVYLAGILMPWVNTKGAVSGLLVSLTYNVCIVVGQFMKGSGQPPHLPLSVEGCSSGSNLVVDSLYPFINTTTTTTTTNTTHDYHYYYHPLLVNATTYYHHDHDPPTSTHHFPTSTYNNTYNTTHHSPTSTYNNTHHSPTSTYNTHHSPTSTYNTTTYHSPTYNNTHHSPTSTYNNTHHSPTSTYNNNTSTHHSPTSTYNNTHHSPTSTYNNNTHHSPTSTYNTNNHHSPTSTYNNTYHSPTSTYNTTYHSPTSTYNNNTYHSPTSTYNNTHHSPTSTYNNTHHSPTSTYNTTHHSPTSTYNNTHHSPTSTYNTTHHSPTSTYNNTNTHHYNNTSTHHSPTSTYNNTHHSPTSTYNNTHHSPTSTYNNNTHHSPTSTYNNTHHSPTSTYNNTHHSPTSTYNNNTNNHHSPTSTYNTTHHSPTSTYNNTHHSPTSTYNTTHHSPTSTYNNKNNNNNTHPVSVIPASLQDLTDTPPADHIVNTQSYADGVDSEDGISLYDVSYCYFGMTGIVITMIVSGVVSLFTRPLAPDEIEDKFFHPPCRKLHEWLWKLSTPTHSNIVFTQR